MSFSMTRQQTLVRTAGFACALAVCALAFADQSPNIILCMGDDHGWDEVGYNGHPHVQTPVLDDMASQGLRLDRFHSGHPSCSPTRGSFITGRHPNRYGTFYPNCSIRPEVMVLTSGTPVLTASAEGSEPTSCVARNAASSITNGQRRRNQV